jgi:Flp pilus assembly protein CpaB
MMSKGVIMRTKPMAIVMCLAWTSLPGTHPLKAEQPLQAVVVLVAKADIAPGTLLTKPQEYFKQVRYVKGDEPKGFISDLAKLQGKRVVRLVAEGQPVHKKHLSCRKSNTFKLPPKMVAFTFTNAVEGRPTMLTESRVDVVAKANGISKIIVEDVLVVAMDEAPTGDEPDVPEDVLILAVTPKQALLLKHALIEGTLRVILRPDDPPAKGKDSPPQAGTKDFPRPSPVRLPRNMRAVAIRVLVPTELVAEYKSGTKVTIISEVPRRDGNVGTKTLLTNVLLLATNQRTEEPARKGVKETPLVATVALMPHDVYRVILAQEFGTIRLVKFKLSKKE